MSIRLIYRQFFICFILWLTSINAVAQDTITSRQWFEIAEYYLFNKQYTQAAKIYENLLEKDLKNTNIYFHLSLCYLNLPNENKKAIYYLKKIFSSSTISAFNPQNDYFIWLGRLYHIDHPEELKTTNEIASTGFKFDPYKPYNNLAISGDGKTLIFINSQKSENRIFYVYKSANTWSEAVDITSQIRSGGNCFPSSLSYNGKRLYITKYDNFESDIYVSSLSEKGWSGMRKLNGNINSSYWDTHACESPDEQVLYFASNRPGGFGGMDIYYSIKIKNDWIKPINAGMQINTFMNDDYPLLINGGQTLIFSSQGFKRGKDGYDIYYCNAIGENIWTVPVNLGYPVNSSEDDMIYVPLTDESHAFFNLSLLNNKSEDAVAHGKNLLVSGSLYSDDSIMFSDIIIQVVENSYGNILSSSRVDSAGRFLKLFKKGDYTLKFFYKDNQFKTTNLFIPFITIEDTANININIKQADLLRISGINDSTSTFKFFADYNRKSTLSDSVKTLKKNASH